MLFREAVRRDQQNARLELSLHGVIVQSSSGKAMQSREGKPAALVGGVQAPSAKASMAGTEMLVFDPVLLSKK